MTAPIAEVAFSEISDSTLWLVQRRDEKVHIKILRRKEIERLGTFPLSWWH